MLPMRLRGRVPGIHAGRSGVHAGRVGMGSGPPSLGDTPIFAASLLSTLVPEIFGGSSTPTFTRATTAYVTDFEGLLKPVFSGEARFTGARRVRNLFATKSEDFSNAAWTKSGASVVGTQNVTWAAGGAKYLYQAMSASVTGRTYRLNVKIRSNTGASQKVRLFAENTAATTGDLAVTTVDQVLSLLYTFAGGTDNVGIQAASDNSAGDFIVSYMHYEEVTGQSNQNPSEYVSVGVASAPYHGANVDGVKYFSTENGNTVASNVVTEATGSAISPSTTLGYLAEGARTNLLTYSNDLTNAAWAAATMTTAKTSTGPDGVANSATRCTASGAAATLLQVYVAAAASRTTSMWIRRVTGTGTVKLFQGATKSADLSASLNTLTYTKVEMTASVDITLLGTGIELGTSGDAVDVWCAQLEAAAFASSPIPTTTVAVTRNADQLQYALTGNISGVVGSAYTEVSLNFPTGYATEADFISSDIGVPLYYDGATAKLTLYDGAGRLGNVLTPSQTVQKIASSWGGSACRTVISGVASSELAFDGNVNLGGALEIGYGAALSHMFGTSRNVKVYGATLTPAQLASLTT